LDRPRFWPGLPVKKKDMNEPLKTISRGIAIILITLLAYIPAMRAGFVWDDDAFLTENELIHAEDGLYRFWFTTEPPDYFPLVSTMLWLEWRLWGMNATGYHVVNILLHATSAMLIWLALRRLKIPGAWLAGLVFAVHPVTVESVAWITERKNTLPLVFYMLTILLYLTYETNEAKRWYVASLFIFLLALLSKTSVVMLPAVLLGLAWWQRGAIARKDFLRSLPFFALSILMGLVTVWFQYNSAGAGSIRADSFLSRLTIGGRAIWFYLYKAVWPCELCFVYPRWRTDSYTWMSFMPLLALFACIILFWRYRNTWGRPFLLGLGYFVVTLLPVLGFVNIYFMKYSLVADHWQYNSLIGIIALIVGIGTHIVHRWKKVLRPVGVVSAIALVTTFSLLTWKQSGIFQNKETLWQDTISKNPNAWVARADLGYSLAKQGDFDGTVRHFSQALRINPKDANAHYNLGVALFKQGKLKKATRHFSNAISIKPDYAEAHNNLGIALARQGKLDQAIFHFSRAFHIKPDFREAQKNLRHALELTPYPGRATTPSGGGKP
jgi:tetratricopeptide (TPR) repeat protein